MIGSQEKTNKQMEETIKTVQDLKMEIKEIKERYNEGNWDEKNLGIQTGTSEASFTNKIQDKKTEYQAMKTQ